MRSIAAAELSDGDYCFLVYADALNFPFGVTMGESFGCGFSVGLVEVVAAAAEGAAVEEALVFERERDLIFGCLSLEPRCL